MKLENSTHAWHMCAVIKVNKGFVINPPFTTKADKLWIVSSWSYLHNSLLVQKLATNNQTEMPYFLQGILE